MTKIVSVEAICVGDIYLVVIITLCMHVTRLYHVVEMIDRKLL